MDKYIVTDILGNKHIVYADSVDEYETDNVTFSTVNQGHNDRTWEVVAQFTRRNIIGYVKENSYNENNNM